MREASEVLDDLMRFPAAVAAKISYLEMDGYFTAVSIGPGAVDTDAWIADLWPEEQACDDPEMVRQMERAFLDHYERSANQLDGPAKDYRPLCLPLDPAQPPTIERASEWSQGFWKAIMRDPGWKRLFNDKHARHLLLPMVLFAKDPMGNALFGHKREQLERMLDGLAGVAADCILHIQNYHREDALPPFRRNGSLHIGRNDPCFCGSGKKYKRCCGAH